MQADATDLGLVHRFGRRRSSRRQGSRTRARAPRPRRRNARERRAPAEDLPPAAAVQLLAPSATFRLAPAPSDGRDPAPPRIRMSSNDTKPPGGRGAPRPRTRRLCRARAPPVREIRRPEAFRRRREAAACRATPSCRPAPVSRVPPRARPASTPVSDGRREWRSVRLTVNRRVDGDDRVDVLGARATSRSSRR